MMNGNLRERSIFLKAIDFESPHQRAAYLDDACKDDPELRESVEALLEANRQSGDLLDRSALDATADIPPLTETIGTVIGPYKLMEQIGEGGMGIVFVAEQEEPVRRKVALKIIKPGMDSKEVIARFEAERHALGLMDHPNIARVIDAGTTETARPYFVMELVRGVPITDYCDNNKLTTRQRLDLFIIVCRAVQHAHQKGIIHRDIKPSNVLVTLHDGVPVPKVIDFGVAKAISQKLTEQTLYTQFSQMVGTPLYMSPEQAEMSGLDVDTRADVYSLGVLLYELLTGSTPFDRQTLRDAGFDEMRRIIREDEPPRPSDRISTLHAQALSTLSSQHSIDPPKFSRLVKGELDWITMKALEKDRTRRYESASAFAADVQRYLDDDPVEACPPSATYRLKKFARRNKVVLAMATLVSVGLVMGIVGLAVSNHLISKQRNAAQVAQQQENKQRLEAERQRQQAEENLRLARDEAARADENFRQARATVDEYLTHVSENMLLNQPGLQPLRRNLLELALKYYQRFVEQRDHYAALQEDLADAYTRVATIKGEIGSLGESLKAYRQALTIREQLAHSARDDLRQHIALASALRQVASKLRQMGGNEDAATDAINRAFEILERLQEQHSTSDEVLLAYVGAYRHKLTTERNPQAYLAGAQRALELIKSVRKDHASYLSERAACEGLVARRYSRSAEVASSRADKVSARRKAITHYQNSAEFHERLEKKEPALKNRQALAMSLLNLAGGWARLGRELTTNGSNNREGLNAVQKSLAIQERAIDIQQTLAAENPLVANYSIGLAALYHNRSVGLSPLFESTKDAALLDEAMASTILCSEIRGRLLQQFPRRNNPRLFAQMAHCIAFQAARLPNLSEEKKQRLLEQGIAVIEKAIELRKETGPTLNDGPRWWYLAMLLVRNGETDKARSYYDRLVTELKENPKLLSSNVDYYLQTADLLGIAAVDHYVQIRDGLASAIEVKTPNYYRCYQYALLCLGTQQVERYRVACASMLKQFSSTEQPKEAHLSAWTSAIAPQAVEDYEPVIELARRAVELQPGSRTYVATLGAILYRAGRYQEALKHLETANSIAEYSDVSYLGYGWYFLAMTHHKLGDEVQGKQWCHKAVEWTNEFLDGNGENQESVHWNWRLTLELLRSEATDLLGITTEVMSDSTKVSGQVN